MTTLNLTFLCRREQSRGVPAGRRKLSMGKIAARAGITRQYLYKLLDGAQPSPELTARLAKALHVRAAYMRRALRATARSPKRRST